LAPFQSGLALLYNLANTSQFKTGTSSPLIASAKKQSLQLKLAITNHFSRYKLLLSLRVYQINIPSNPMFYTTKYSNKKNPLKQKNLHFRRFHANKNALK
jgi:hypothetical protein